MSDQLTQQAPGRGRSSAKSGTISRLIQAARTEFAAKGLAGAKIDNIARAAGVTKQLVYHYYNSKEDLFTAVLAHASAETMPKLLAREFDHLSPPEALRAFLDEVFDQYRNDPLLGSLHREGLRFHEDHQSQRSLFLDLAPSLITKMEHIIERGVASGDFRPDVNARHAMAAASLLLTGGFTNRRTASVLAGFETSSGEGMEKWRRIAADFVLASVLNT